MVKRITGSGIADDNTYTYDAHIGYYTDYQKKYVLLLEQKSSPVENGIFMKSWKMV